MILLYIPAFLTYSIYKGSHSAYYIARICIMPLNPNRIALLNCLAIKHFGNPLQSKEVVASFPRSLFVMNSSIRMGKNWLTL